MNACPEYEELLTLQATGALEPEQEARVREHLATCAACRSEAESTARLLSGMALPPPSPAMRQRMEALPQRALRAWRRAQVRQAFRARTVGAMLAAAAAVLLVVNPSLRSTGKPSSAVTPPAPSASQPETAPESEFEQWAVADPLGDELDSLLADEDVDDWGEEAEAEPSASELFLDPNVGEMP
jgi:anti-sigma factor RsiW